MQTNYQIDKTYFYSGEILNLNPYEEFKVFKQTILKGKNFSLDFCVIGESHFVLIPEIDYFEVMVNKPLDYAKASFDTNSLISIKLENQKQAKFTSTTKINTVHIKDFNRRNYTHAYEFAKDAYTTYSILLTNNKIAIFTAHTYPEFEVAIKTTTVIKIN